ncbi:cytochrome b/b6 domain-containing protein [Microbacterium sp. BLY]|uniref:cytochrome b/b6 domain-containing protein n=1 Tax=Microbacterium sp. BLY TaxID=2823280 RepID=UPI001B33BC14|nr:cytochrome b/b6 domain-containing protein [Microbacterium sp. BLY]MBP3976480.1 cytochrome b/b6 domain-containing protein [Microbacterium sp. BLY]
MATRVLRRGLPRVPGGEPWPPADVTVDAVDAVEPSGVTAAVDAPAATPVATPAERAEDRSVPHAPDDTAPAATPDAAPPPALRRGLPRVPGGEPWPPSAASPGPAAAPGAAAQAAPTAADAPTPPAPAAPASASTAASPTSDPASDAVPAPTTSAGGESVRRGLPRVPGGEPWPPAGTAPARAATAAAVTPDAALIRETPSPAAPPAEPAAPGTALAPAADISTPLPWTRTVWDGRAPRHLPAAAPTARRRPTWTQAIAALFGAAALGVLAAAAVALVRALLSLPFLQDFLAAYPGEYEPPIPVEPGFAPWVNWAHFFNMFLIVLIIRSGLQVRTEKRPSVFWTPRNNPKGKISLNLWFHQALDILWLLNGVIFVVLLFTTGHWVRIVPTSWEVFPNALSAALQYISFDWPHENGWNNYNSLQQLAYFVTVFVAAPLAAVTGFRMSGLWPKKAERLSKAYPVEWARALHFPVMLYFVAFIIAHVALVMLTGFLRNLNHMFAAQDAATWTGFWVFIASLVVIAIAWVAARPLVLAPIAKLFGKVSGR